MIRNMPPEKMISGIFTRLAIERLPEVSFFNTTSGEVWLNDALDRAKRTSIASVQNLKDAPRYWFILVDSSLKPELKQRSLATFQTITQTETRLIEVDGWDETSSALEKDQHAKSCHFQVRLDYDDLLHRNYFDEVFQAIKSKKPPFVISPTLGISHNYLPTRIALIHKRLAPFLCLFRLDRSSDLTVFSFDHDQWPDNMIVELDEKPLWIQSITGNNITNTFGHGWMVSKVRFVRHLDLMEWTGEETTLVSETRLVAVNLRERIREIITVYHYFFAKCKRREGEAL